MRNVILIMMLLVMPFYLFAQSQAKPQSQFLPQTPHVPVEVYGQLPSKSMMVISPSGDRVAYRDTSNNRDIMMVLELSGLSILAAIDLSSVRPDNAYFIDNDRLIFVVSQNKSIRGFRGRADFSAAFAYNLKSKKMHQLLVPGYGIYKGQTQLGIILGISADKKYAYMPAYKDGISSYSLFKVNLERKRLPKIHRRGTSDTIDFFLDENGEVIARERYNNASNIHRIEAWLNDEWQEIFREETPFKTKRFSGVTSDGKSLVMTTLDQKNRRSAFYTMFLADGKISEPIFSHEDKDVEHILTDIQRVVHGVRYSGFTPSYEFFDEKLNARMRGLAKALPNNTFSIKSYTPHWNSMVFYMDGEQSAGDYALYQNGSMSMLASSRPEIPPQAVHPVKEYSFKARDGLNIPSLITIPIGQVADKLPAIMLPHGGPESYDRLGFDWMAQYFASQGYVVIQPQFRGSKGFGLKHLIKGRGEWGRKMQDDLTDAVNDLVSKGIIDKSRVCIVGASYGGYAALAGAVFTPDLYKCVVSINGVSDIKRMLDTEAIDHGSDHWVVAYWQTVISKGDVKKDHLQQISPINYVTKVKAPVLLIHGEWDEIVPFEQSENMFDELEDADKNVTFIELEKGDHYLSNAKNRMKALKAIDKFIKQFI